jgi:hypothetical protein
MKTKIIACTGYGGSGSSAITDLMREFNCGISLGDAEFWFLQDYDGISDLEHYLIEGNHRSKVNLAIKRFLKYVYKNERFYSKYFGDKYQRYSMNYIENLIDAEFKKSISQYEINNSILRKIIFNISPFFQRAIKKPVGGEFTPFIPRVTKHYSYPGKEKFYKETKKYTANLFSLLTDNLKNEFIAIDQLVPSTNTARYFNYVGNMFVINIDRDPRDLYLLNETVWKGASYVCDTKDIESFINWFKTMRAHKQYEIQSKKILYMKLEEMIYKYDHALEKIYNFFDLNPSTHINKMKFFNPEISKKNTRLWMKKENKVYQKNINEIEKSLSEYCS